MKEITFDDVPVTAMSFAELRDVLFTFSEWHHDGDPETGSDTGVARAIVEHVMAEKAISEPRSLR